jgi:hypothetical protein
LERCGIKKRTVEVYDNIFDSEFVDFAYRYYRDKSKWSYSNTSGSLDDNSRFFWADSLETGCSILECPIQQFIFEQIQKTAKFRVIDYRDEHIYINGQTYMLDGTLHADEHLTPEKMEENNYYTILYMVNSDATNIQGFETTFDSVDFVPGRVVIFDSFIPHRGLSTTVKDEMRMTLTWKSFQLDMPN